MALPTIPPSSAGGPLAGAFSIEWWNYYPAPWPAYTQYLFDLNDPSMKSTIAFSLNPIGQHDLITVRVPLPMFSLP